MSVIEYRPNRWRAVSEALFLGEALLVASILLSQQGLTFLLIFAGPFLASLFPALPPIRVQALTLEGSTVRVKVGDRYTIFDLGRVTHITLRNHMIAGPIVRLMDASGEMISFVADETEGMWFFRTLVSRSPKATLDEQAARFVGRHQQSLLEVQ